MDNRDTATRPDRAARLVARCLLVAIPIVGIVYALKLPSYVGYAIWREQAALLVLGLGLSGALLVQRGGGGRGGARLLADSALAALALGICLGTAYRYEDLVAVGYLGMGTEYVVNLACASIVLLILAEVVRRLAGMAMIGLLAVFVGYAFVADHMPGFLRGQAPTTDFLVGYTLLDSNGVLGSALSVVVTTVISYVLLGSALFKLGGGQMFLDLSLAVMGRYRGGSAKAAVVASSLFGTVSGSAVANVVTTGIVTIPLMKQTGFRPERAGAVEAVASTGGQLLPPVMGAAAFIMADFLGVGYAEVALAALIPALFYYFAVFVQIHLSAARAGLEPLPASQRPSARATLRTYWVFLVPLAILVHLLFIEGWQPEMAALVSTAAVLVAGAIHRRGRVRPGDLLAILEDTGRSLLDIVAITAAAGVIIGVLTLTGLGFALGLGFVAAAGDSVLLLLVIAAFAAIIFGMGMPTTAVYILMATLVAPALVKGGIEPIAAHLFVLYFGVLSMITPPVCMASFAAASLAGAPFMRTGWESMKLGAVALMIPFLFVASPALLMQSDDPMEIARAVLTGMAGCVFLGAAIEGYLVAVMAAPLRLLSAAAGLSLLLPDGGSVMGPWAGYSDPLGVLLAILVLAWMWVSHRRAGSLSVQRIAAE